MTNTHAVYDLFAAAYLLALDIPIASAAWDGSMVRFDFDNTDNRAAIAAETYRNSEPALPVRKLLNAFKTIQVRVRQERTGAVAWHS